MTAFDRPFPSDYRHPVLAAFSLHLPSLCGLVYAVCGPGRHLCVSYFGQCNPLAKFMLIVATAKSNAETRQAGAAVAFEVAHSRRVPTLELRQLALTLGYFAS